MCKINEVIYQQILTAHYYWKNVIILKELFAKEIIFVLKEIFNNSVQLIFVDKLPH